MVLPADQKKKQEMSAGWLLVFSGAPKRKEIWWGRPLKEKTRKKKWKRLRDGWILDPFTAIRLYLLFHRGTALSLREVLSCGSTGTFRRRLLIFCLDAAERERKVVQAKTMVGQPFQRRKQTSGLEEESTGWTLLRVDSSANVCFLTTGPIFSFTLGR